MTDQPAIDVSDRELLDRMRRSDSSAFSTLMTRHGAAVYRYAWALADESSQVDDLTQEAFLVLWKQRRTLSIVGVSVLPWLLTTCRFTAFNANRRSRKERSLALVPQVTDGRATAHADASAQLEWIREEIGRLGDVDQKLCQLCLVEGRSYKDAAQSLGITPAAARKRIQRTREHLAAARAFNE